MQPKVHGSTRSLVPWSWVAVSWQRSIQNASAGFLRQRLNLLCAVLCVSSCCCQLRAVAEAAIRELQAKVKDREEQLAQLTAKLQEHQAAYLAQHAKDR
jgi:hypothetical protein